MKLKHYELICLIIFLFLGHEYAVINGHFHSESLLKKIAAWATPQYQLNLNPTPGHPLSYLLGCLGFGIMVLMNTYILRKRFGFFKNWGKLSSWLDFHIFCGMLGPILIIFHSNFEVKGLVAISFWSMIVSASSGIVGRYFYVQTLKKKEDIRNYIAHAKKDFMQRHQGHFPAEKFEVIFEHAFSSAGVKGNTNNPFLVFISSLKADVSLLFTNPGKPFGLNQEEGEILKKMGVEHRRSMLLEPFKQLLGYWHSFHLPFAVFMYIVAVIHIIVALLFGVKH